MRRSLQSGLGVGLLCMSGGVLAAGGPGNAQAELDALIKAARAEGEVMFYTSTPENVAKRSAESFTAKYRVRAQFVRLGGTQLEVRYSAEAESSTMVADLVVNAGGNIVSYAENGIRQGFVESISEAGIPVLTSGEFPRRFVPGPTAIIQVTPWLIAYNTEKVAVADAPRDWPDLLNPKFKGQVLIPHPGSGSAYVDLWTLILDKYGEKFFDQLRSQGLRQYPSAVPVIQALAAGEGAIAVPSVSALVAGLNAKGAPLGMAIPDTTTGVEMQITLSARRKVKHPAAARLFANYLMSPEGNRIFNDDPGGVTVYDTTRLPKDYQSPKANALARRDHITRLLGF